MNKILFCLLAICFVITTGFAQAMVAEKVKGNRFVIKTNAPNTEVSWQVAGV